METELGAVRMELYPDQAPNTVTNFLEYVDGGFFDGGTFHRTVHEGNQPDDSIRIAVIQGDISGSRRSDRLGAIGLERTNKTGLKHLDGTVSMARSGPDTATSSFFICIGDQPELDFGGHRNPDGQGFAAFGRVVEGMDVVKAIHRSPAEGQSLSPPIRILKVMRTRS
jgi:peptidyl-prolyl cis-trans isomerase A (cyclophilin A)